MKRRKQRAEIRRRIVDVLLDKSVVPFLGAGLPMALVIPVMDGKASRNSCLVSSKDGCPRDCRSRLRAARELDARLTGFFQGRVDRLFDQAAKARSRGFRTVNNFITMIYLIGGKFVSDFLRFYLTPTPNSEAADYLFHFSGYLHSDGSFRHAIDDKYTFVLVPDGYYFPWEDKIAFRWIALILLNGIPDVNLAEYANGISWRLTDARIAIETDIDRSESEWVISPIDYQGSLHFFLTLEDYLYAGDCSYLMIPQSQPPNYRTVIGEDGEVEWIFEDQSHLPCDDPERVDWNDCIDFYEKRLLSIPRGKLSLHFFQCGLQYEKTSSRDFSNIYLDASIDFRRRILVWNPFQERMEYPLFIDCFLDSR